jgi:hypothetical protein
VCCVLFERGVLFCVMCIICLLCLPPGKNSFVVKINNNNNNNLLLICEKQYGIYISV